MHPSTYVPKERGESGSHHVACEERILSCTGRPVQPHEPLPEDYVMPDGHPRWKWVPLLSDVAETLRLEAGSSSPDQAASLCSRVRAQPGAPTDAEEEVVEGKTYVPDAEGFKVTLPDGCQPKCASGTPHPTRRASAQSGGWRTAVSPCPRSTPWRSVCRVSRRTLPSLNRSFRPPTRHWSCTSRTKARSARRATSSERRARSTAARPWVLRLGTWGNSLRRCAFLTSSEGSTRTPRRTRRKRFASKRITWNGQRRC